MTAFSYALRSLQRGTIPLNNSNTTDNVTITAVDTARSRTFGGTHGGNDDDAVEVRLAAATTVTWLRQTGTSIATAVVPWTVVEGLG